MTKTMTKPAQAQISLARIKTDRCIHCRASEGIHQYETGLCPVNGREETRVDSLTGRAVPQRWAGTKFEDNGEWAFYREAPSMAIAMDCLASRLMSAPAAKPGTARFDADVAALKAAAGSMEAGGVAGQCPTYSKLQLVIKKMEAARA